jgi:hypothetical protein
MLNLIKETIPGAKPFTANSDVYLEASHIVIKKDIAGQLFGTENFVLTVYYAKDNTFLLAPADEEVFVTIHKGTQALLKNKNAAGDRSIAIHELLLDNDITTENRDLEFVIENGLRILKIKL